MEGCIRDFYKRGVRSVTLTNSGSSANLLAITAIKQPEFGNKAAKDGDEVITSAVGFPTTVSGIIQNNLKPVLVDVELPTYVPTVDMIEAAITPRTRAIMLAHPLGNPFALQRLRDLADEYNLWLIGDCCDAMGSTIDGEMVGTVEDISTLSFYPAHMMTTGEGGAVMTNSPMVKKVVDSLGSWGRDCWCDTGKDNTCGKRFDQKCGSLPYGYDHKYIYSRLGYNLKLTDIQAALGVSQIRKLPEFNKQRKVIWNRMYEGFKQFEDFFMLPKSTKGSDPVWFGFPLTVNKRLPFNRHDLITYLERRKIGTRLFFGGNLVHQPAFKNLCQMSENRFYNADAVTTDTFWLGSWHGITEPMVDYVVEVVKDFIMEKTK